MDASRLLQRARTLLLDAEGASSQPLAVRALVQEIDSLSASLPGATPKSPPANEMLHQSEERFRLLVESVKDYAIFMLDPDGYVVSWNRGAERIKGYKASEIIGQHFSVFYPPEDQDKPARELLIARAEGRFEEEGVRLRHDGTRFWAHVVITAIFDSEGILRGFAKVTRDVTERREAQAATFFSEASRLLASDLDYNVTLQRVASAAVPRIADWAAVDVLEGEELRRVAVAHVDPAKVQWAHELRRRYPVNPSAARGAPRVARTGEAELYPEITDEMLVASAVDEEYLRLTRSLGLRSGIIVPLIAHGAPLGALSLVSAESGRRYTEKDLEVAEELGRRAGMAIDNARLYREARDALQLRDEFISIAGHELRTPLTALMLRVAGLDRLVKRADRVDVVALEERLEKILGNCRRLASLINELLDVSRITSGHLDLTRERVDLAALASEVIERSQEELKASGSEIQFEGEPVAGEWDRLRLDQVITNLLSNAIKYGEKKPLRVSVQRSEERALLVVHDDGIGISLDDQARIFGRFERAVSVRNFGGLGLGLWISRQIVEAHGGSISVRSAPGAGATFTVELPCLPSRPTALSALSRSP